MPSETKSRPSSTGGSEEATESYRDAQGRVQRRRKVTRVVDQSAARPGHKGGLGAAARENAEATGATPAPSPSPAAGEKEPKPGDYPTVTEYSKAMSEYRKRKSTPKGEAITKMLEEKK